MPQYAAILGHQPHISIAELAAVAPGFAQTGTFEKFILLFESSADLSQETLNHLGGIIVMAKQIQSSSGLALEDIPKIVANETAGVKGKITFGLRCYGITPKEVHALYRESKHHLKKAGRPSRYIGTERKPAVPVLLHDTGVVNGQHGCEIMLLSAKKGFDGGAEVLPEPELWFGRTVFAQDIDAYAKRDMEKPARDTTVGLLPPKLAQILLNFGAWLAKPGSGLRTSFGSAQDKSDKGKPTKSEIRNSKSFTILDPFCGTGVIPMEALLRGWNVIASDIMQKAVNACDKNLEWLRKEESILKRDVTSTVFKHDAVKPFDLKEMPDMIVTETSLGPPLTHRPTIKDAQKLKTENEKLQAGFLKNMAVCFPGVPVVCTWPVWYHSKGQIHLEKIWETLHDIGYHATLPPGIESDVEGRLSLVYRRPDQFVGREIVMLVPKK
ncbi:hypothetical protein A3D88_04725 [Candidatus Peribacteria bacterium RIFCSPHIGHO2_02_FULL_52_16]|nr:MAG: hypothetical protein A2706_03355 [Candidatus Peribacteria bacterium RIFCSPHIGHO2_01_FULL_51_35]OGJ60906.1 MAG: hypothetical protein A3D88_04725 [Candidatus Peribacteria bacterium RIFCSPHIGHO2_02_FULL_52_16]